jgi:hypothetical protein
VTLPTGGTYSYEYPGANDSINCATGEATSLKRTINDGSSSAVWNFALQADGSVREVTPENNRVVFTFASDGKTLTQQAYQGDSDAAPLLRGITTAYSASGLPFTKTDTVTLDDGAESKVETDIDGYGNATEVREYGWGKSAPGGLMRTTSVSYTANDPTYAARNILGRVTQKLVKDAAGVVKSRTVIAYDGHDNSTCVTDAGQHDNANYGCSFTTWGNPSSVTTYANAAAVTGPITTNLYYDSVGNLRQTDGSAPQKTWTYSSLTQYAYPESSTIGSGAPSLTTSATYNPYTGLVASATDENSQKTWFTYESITNRLKQIKRPDNATVDYSYDDSARTATVKVPLTGGSQTGQITSYDGLGRPINVSSADSSGSIVSAVDTKYDLMGRPNRVSNPYTGSPQYWTETDYDPLGRPLMVIPPDGSSSSNYTSYAWKRGDRDRSGREPAPNVYRCSGKTGPGR